MARKQKTGSFKPEDNTKDQTRKSSSRSRRGSRRSGKPASDTALGSNKLLSQATYETPVGPATTLYPTDCMSIASTGTITSAPGQDNFVESYTDILNQASAVQKWNVTANDTAKRTANVMALDFVHYFGALHGSDLHYYSTSPILTAALNIKQYVDTSFGTNTDYDPHDLILYIMAVSAIFPMIAEIKRNIRLAVTEQMNVFPAFVPRGLFAAARISDGSNNYLQGEGAMYTAQHLRSLVDQLNQQIMIFNRLPMPPEILAFGINDDLFDAIWADTPDTKSAQLYIFRNSAWWTYEEPDPVLHTGTTIKYNDAQGATTVQKQIDRLRQAIEKITALRTSSTAMLQNLYNAYGSADTVQVPTMDPSNITSLEIIYNPDILSEIENCTMITTSDSKISDISYIEDTQTLTGVVYIYEHGTEAYNLAVDVPLQFHKPQSEITPNDIGHAMRFHPSFCERGNVPFVVGGVEQIEEVTHAAGYTGFGFIRDITILSISSTGSLTHTAYVTRSFVNMGTYLKALDFAVRPIQVYFSSTVDTSSQKTFSLNGYSATRDVELTHRREDINMFWTYLTQTVWAANVNRNTVGSRTRR